MWWLWKKPLFWWKGILSSFTPDPPCQLDILGHDGDSLSVDGTQVSVFEKTNQIGLAGFLQRHDGRALETKICLEVLCYFTDQALKWQFSNQQLSRLLVAPDLSQCNCAGSIAMGFLDSSCSRGALAGSFGCQLLSWGLASCRFSSSLLCTSHVARNVDRLGS